MNALRSVMLCLSVLFFLDSEAQFIHNTIESAICIDNRENIQFAEYLPNYRTTTDMPETCLNRMDELSQVWLKIKTATSSELSLTIEPINGTDDIDFAVFEMKLGKLNLLRCMASGYNLDRSTGLQSNCGGATGMRSTASDLTEKIGCSIDHDNFVKSIYHEDGQEFFILVTNYHSTNGFNLVWTGTSTFDSEYCTLLPNNRSIEITRVYPNPAHNQVQIQISTTRSCEANLEIIDNEGRILLVRSLSLVDGVNTQSIALSKLPSGMQFCRVSNDQNSSVRKFEIIH